MNKRFTDEQRKDAVARVLAIKKTEGLSFDKACERAGVGKYNFTHWRSRFKSKSSPTKTAPPKQPTIQLPQSLAARPVCIIVGNSDDINSVIDKLGGF